MIKRTTPTKNLYTKHNKIVKTNKYTNPLNYRAVSPSHFTVIKKFDICKSSKQGVRNSN